MSPNDFGDFSLALPGGQTLKLWSEKNYKIGLVKQPHTAIFYFLLYKTCDVSQETSKTPA